MAVLACSKSQGTLQDTYRTVYASSRQCQFAHWWDVRCLVCVREQFPQAKYAFGAELALLYGLSSRRNRDRSHLQLSRRDRHPFHPSPSGRNSGDIVSQQIYLRT